MYQRLIDLTAIEYIQKNQAQERTFATEVSRLRAEADYAREAQKENELLRTEVCVMHERLRRLDPASPHIYGHYTSQLTQHQSQANGQPAQVSLPPMNTTAPPSQQYNGMPPPAAMQGVEYGMSRPSYEMR